MCQCLSLPNYHPYGEAWQCNHALGTAGTTRLVRDMEKPNPSPPLFPPLTFSLSCYPGLCFAFFYHFWPLRIMRNCDASWGVWQPENLLRFIFLSHTQAPFRLYENPFLQRHERVVEAFQNRPRKFDLNSLGGPYERCLTLSRSIARWHWCTCLSHSSCSYTIFNGSADVNYLMLRKCHRSGNVWIPAAFVAIWHTFGKKSIMAPHLARWGNLWAEEEIWYQVSGTVWDTVYGNIARLECVDWPYYELYLPTKMYF